MVFRTGRMVTVDQHDDPYYDKLSDVPGIEKIESEELRKFIQDNLKNPGIVDQALDTRYAGLSCFAKNSDGERVLIASNGFRSLKFLGNGKDSSTIFAERYRETDAPGTKYIFKLWSAYGSRFSDNSLYLVKRLNQQEQIHPALTRYRIKTDYMYYIASEPCNPVSRDPAIWHAKLAEACGINRWMVENCDMLFWDFGFGSGKNYMVDHKARLVWVDYGGAGMLRHPRLKDTVEMDEFPVLKDSPEDKPLLVWANSLFLMTQFILHIEYWANRHKNQETTAQTYAIMAQTDLNLLQELNLWALPNILRDNLAKEVFINFNKHDWLDHMTWKRVGKFINEYAGKSFY